MLTAKEPSMHAPVAKLLEINRDPATRALYEAREKERRDNLARERYAMQKGIAEGMQKGKVEGEQQKALAVARNAFEMGMSIEDIARLTGLACDEINKLLK